ncbi:DUF1566 domain-containing protein [Nitrospina sp. 32_T5]|uniref:Lcl C-terminal domain-containing protein n=1 Tax=unclassified Nitrospina TaxID=2638683 RepID=UPI003F9E1D7F
MDAKDLYEDTPRGVIVDKKMNLEWLPKDARGDLGKWVTWDEANYYIQTMRNVYAGGHADWRLPTKEEALSLYNEDLTLVDWEGEAIHIHPAFVPKCGRVIWTSEVNDEGQACAVNLQDGTAEFVDKLNRDEYTTRLVRSSNSKGK